MLWTALALLSGAVGVLWQQVRLSSARAELQALRGARDAALSGQASAEADLARVERALSEVRRAHDHAIDLLAQCDDPAVLRQRLRHILAGQAPASVQPDRGPASSALGVDPRA